MPRDYCLYATPDEPGRRCHRPKGHEERDDQGHAELPNAADWREYEETVRSSDYVSPLRAEYLTGLPSIALIAKRKSGKSTIARQLVERYGYVRHSWADGVRAIFAMAYDPEVNDPDKYEDVKRRLYTIREIDGFETQVTGGWLLQRIGTDAMRDRVDLDFWIKAGMRKIDLDEVARRSETDSAAIRPRRWVNDDTRFPNEVEALRERGFVIVGLAVNENVRRARVGFDGRMENHPSETSVSLDDADFVVDTSQTIDATMTDLLNGLNVQHSMTVGS